MTWETLRQPLYSVFAAAGGVALILALIKHEAVLHWIASRCLALAEMRAHWRRSVTQAEARVGRRAPEWEPNMERDRR